MASKSKLEDLNLTRDEVKRLGEALKDEKFRDLLREYAEEISDPENRRRYEEEIAEMERERGMDVTFITPEPGYVLKTSVNGDKKAFINISKSDKIDKPSSERKHNVDGKSGLMWHIPHSFAPPKEDFDKQKNRCNVYDFVIHPDTYRMTECNDGFKKMVEDTAMDGIDKQFQVTVDRKNVKRPKMKFKGTPTATVIRNKTASGPQPAADASGLLKDMPYPYDSKTTAEKMKEREEMQAKKSEEDEAKMKKTTKSQANENKKESDATVPKYTIIHRSELDMQEYRNAPDAKPSTRPRELVIKIELPLLKAASQANLDIFEKRLLLESKVPAVYKLDLPLPYAVDESEGSAKFDKQKRILVITLPVIPEEAPGMPSFANGPSAQEEGSEEGCSAEKPLVEVLSSSTDNNADPEQPRENGISGESGDNINNTSGVEEKMFPSHISYTLPDFSFTQDTETVSFVLKVKNVSEDSIRRTSPKCNEMKMVCTSRGEGGFPLHFSIFIRFAEICQVATEHCSVDVTDDNVVLLLLKERKSRGIWDRCWVGLNSDDVKEHLFLTISNLQEQLSELDEAAEQMTALPTSGSTNVTKHPPCDLKVTTMNDKKLTVKIVPPQNIEDDDNDETPSSSDIQVVHTSPSPNLHGILKQHTFSESSEDVNPDPESPRSPMEDEDDLSSSANSGKHRSVSFSDHIDKATFKSSASVSSMTTALKSKRKRMRKREERREKANSRKRYNSTGSEGSGDDHSHNLSDSHSHSEGEVEAEDEEKGQGEKGEGLKAQDANVKTPLDFRTNPSNDKTPESDSSVPAQSPSNNLRNGDKEEEAKENCLSDSDKKAASSSDDTAINEGSKMSHSPQGESEGSKKEEESIASKIKSKLAETTLEDRPDDSDDDEEGKSEEAKLSGQGNSNPSSGVCNEHRTECAFDFSNSVMFDLDVE